MSETVSIRVAVNGRTYERAVAPRLLLSDFLRHELALTGTHPGLLMTMLPFLQENPNPTETDIREALSANLCRCTGYQNIVEAVRLAAGRMVSEGVGQGAEGDY